MEYIFNKMSVEEILSTVSNSKVCLLATVSDIPYITPTYYKSEYRDHSLIFKIKTSSLSDKVRNIEKNDNVCIYLEQTTNNITKTIVGKGKCYINKTINDEKTVTLNIIITEISGRKYNRHHICK